MIENNKTITQEKIDEQIKSLDNFLKNPFAKSDFIKTTTPDAGSISLSMPSVS